MADEIIKLFEYFKNDSLIQTIAAGYAIYAIIVVALCILIFAIVAWRMIQHTRNFRSSTKRRRRNRL